MNENYFRVIDNEKKAYFLGLLYADGCNHENIGFSIFLQKRDGILVRTLKKDIQSGHKISLKLKRKESHQDQLGIRISCPKMSHDLSKNGCVPRKSLILKFPNTDIVPEYLIHHFIRGYFDGDGCISVSKRKNRPTKDGRINIFSSYEFCLSLKQIFDYLGIRFTFQKGLKTSASLHSSGTFNILKFYNFIYNGAKIFLSRKKEKFEQLFVMKKFSTNGSKTGSGKSKYRGVYIREYRVKNKIYKYIRAMIIFNKTKIWLGKFDSELEASKAYDKKCLEFHGNKAILNFPKHSECASVLNIISDWKNEEKRKQIRKYS